ncbi:MAG TPA: isoleucine--tRNA ligase [Planctomycetota bacterium]|nr:isoleucine--tRNA ligase [Planctomycetota bacterium]
MNYRDTVNLPKTSFPMKANLRQREPELQKRWREMNLYALVRKARAGGPKFILHDGPPYASGELHIGTGMNKILKDVVVRSRTMMGCDAPFVPGWDCHGLPIEHQVLRELGEGALDAPRMDVRRRCRRFAEKHVRAHIQQFQQLGVLGDFAEPYLTLDPAYERAVVELFADLVEGGYVCKSRKPIHWDYATRSALADAELEYKDVESPAVFVKFPMADDLKGLFPGLGGEPLSMLIWTTTPWTLPANLAIAVAGQAEYSAVRYADPVTGRSEVVVLAEDLIEPVMAKVGVTGCAVVGRCRGRQLEGKCYRHILHDRTCPIVLADYVSLEDGTGCVHTAPGHGREDYETGLKYGLEIFSPVDENGRLTPESGQFAGLRVFEADPKIVEHLRRQGHLLHAETIRHSYPHGWRSKEPVIFRATEQWFVAVDHNGLRQRMLEAIPKVQWIPAWGEGRIAGMVAERPDWCISRQKAWGIPIPAFYCVACGGLLLDAGVVRHVAEVVGREGSDAWFARDAADLLPAGVQCPRCGAAAFRKETDIFDVWFESGSSHRAVLRGPKAERQGLRWPADLYLEGTDQHRGWFQLSMLPAVAADGEPPYRAVLTHGFVVDEKGEKMSKSLGNFLSVEEALKEFGAELQRLWAASVDYLDDIHASRGIIARMDEPYRRFRNTFRYLLSNLHGFDPKTQRVEPGEMAEVDRWALSRTARLIAEARRAYEDYQLYRVYQRTYQFCTVDISSFYLDVIKDRLYCEAADSVARRAAQTVLHEILDALVRLLAPILIHTCEEVWDAMPGRDDLPSVHLARFPQTRDAWVDESLEARWGRLLAVRSDAARELEKLRADKKIGSGLDARVVLHAEGELLEFLRDYQAVLPEILIVSEVAVADGVSADAAPGSDVPGLGVVAAPSGRAKCARCWRLLPSVGSDAEHPQLCARCAAVVRALPRG